MSTLKMDINSERAILQYMKDKILDPSTTNEQVTVMSDLFNDLIKANRRKISMPGYLKKHLAK